MIINKLTTRDGCLGCTTSSYRGLLFAGYLNYLNIHKVDVGLPDTSGSLLVCLTDRYVLANVELRVKETVLGHTYEAHRYRRSKPRHMSRGQGYPTIYAYAGDTWIGEIEIK